MKTLAKTIFVVIIALMNVNCASYLVARMNNAMSQIRLPNKMLLHKNPQKGDYAVWKLDVTHTNIKITGNFLSSIINNKNKEWKATANYTNEITDFTDGKIILTAIKKENGSVRSTKRLIDAMGNILTPSEPSFAIAKPGEINYIEKFEPVSKKTVMVDGYKTIPIITTNKILINFNAYWGLVQSNTDVTTICINYFNPEVKFGIVAQKCEIFGGISSGNSQEFQFLMAVMQMPDYLLNPGKSLSKMNLENLFSLFGKSNKAYNRPDYNYKINYNSYTSINLVEQGNRNK